MHRIAAIVREMRTMLSAGLASLDQAAADAGALFDQAVRGHLAPMGMEGCGPTTFDGMPHDAGIPAGGLDGFGGGMPDGFGGW